MGAWIETRLDNANKQQQYEVAPYVGAWIETLCHYLYKHLTLSHPTWVRGLKRIYMIHLVKVIGRTLRGCVD